MKDWQNSPRIESCLFLLIILIETVIFFYLIHGRWIVGGHDGLQYFTLQYYFLNNVINSGEIPQWLPFMTQGTVATWWCIIQDGLLQNLLLLSGSLFKGNNFLPFFYAGIFVDELLLLVGVWLLARRFFASPFTVFFVTLSIMGSCIWMLQPWWNFHLYYAIPLILYFVHTFIDSGKWRHCFLAGNLLFMQSLGNLTYYLPVTSLVIFLYFLFYFAFSYKEVWQKIKLIRFGWSFVFTTFLSILSFIALYFAMNIGTDQIANYNIFRNLDGTTTLDIFLTYSGNFTWRTWLELFLEASPSLDYTLYIGILCVPFILWGLIFNLNKQNIHILLTIIILLLFGAGTFVSVFFYYSWPMMKYFRHIMLVASIIKIFLCFLAGFGFEAVFFNHGYEPQSKPRDIIPSAVRDCSTYKFPYTLFWKFESHNKSFVKKPFLIKVFFAVTSIFLMGVSLCLWLLSHNYLSYANLIRSMVSETLPIVLFNENVMISLLGHTTLFALAASLLFAVLLFNKKREYFFYFIIFALALQCMDIYGFKFSEIKLKAVPLNEEVYKFINFQNMPYAQRRDVSFQNNNPRAELLKVLPIQYGAIFHWSMHGFLFKDELGNSFRTDHWLLPLDNYMRAYWGQSIHDLSAKPLGLFYYSRLEFPHSHPAALKISGVTEDKIQFFSGADIISSDDTIASKITSADYKGDIIFLSPLEKKNAYVNTSNDLSANKRLLLPYQVQRFDSNNLEVTTNTNNLESVWLLYSDVWHPMWKATVNGKETAVYKANLAYKAVKLEKGFNKVHFYFKSRLISVLYTIFGLNALCWLLIMIYLTGNIAFNSRNHAINYRIS